MSTLWGEGYIRIKTLLYLYICKSKGLCGNTGFLQTPGHVQSLWHIWDEDLVTPGWGLSPMGREGGKGKHSIQITSSEGRPWCTAHLPICPIALHGDHNRVRFGMQAYLVPENLD